MRVLLSTGTARVSQAVLEQLCSKHPSREHPVPLRPPAGQHPRCEVHLTEPFRRLDLDAAAGVSGLRNEYLRVLTAAYDDPHASRVMELYDDFATAAANMELPDWFYHALATSRLVGIIKPVEPGTERADGEPDVRPVAVGERQITAIESSIIQAASADLGTELWPQQLAVGVPGGISLLVHGIRVALEFDPTLVVVKLDLRNAYNACRRSAVLRRMRSSRALAHAVPFLHAMLCTESMLIVGEEQRRLFDHEPGRRGDSSTGVRQGSASSSATFCLAIHPEVVALDRELRPWGGFARFLMDDGYAVGPAHVVFPAVERFMTRVGDALDLEGVPAKSSCFSPRYPLQQCPHREAAQIPVGGRDVLRPGIVVPPGYHVPLSQMVPYLVDKTGSQPSTASSCTHAGFSSGESQSAWARRCMRSTSRYASHIATLSSYTTLCPCSCDGVSVALCHRCISGYATVA